LRLKTFFSPSPQPLPAKQSEALFAFLKTNNASGVASREREKYRALKTLGILASWQWLLDLNSLAKKGILSYNLSMKLTKNKETKQKIKNLANRLKDLKFSIKNKDLKG
jgi:hypothetical protein